MLSLGRRPFPLTSRSMYAVTSRSRGLSSIRQFLHGSALGLQSAAAYSTSGRRSRTMFMRAVKDHSATASTAKPLQSNLLQGNTVSQSKPPQSSGVKRKIESAGESSLGSLHSAVYFDENDFDDDDDLNFEDPDPPIQTQSTVRPDTSVSRQKDSPGDDDDLVVTYPDLPPVPDEEAPPSSIQLPWSSSPPSHFQPPKPPSRVQIPPSSKPRTVPWLNKEELVTKSAPPPVTPARKPKSTAIWNKTASAIKDEQKELRRQSKNQKPEQKRPANAHLAPVFLSDEQRHVLDAVVQLGKSIFFTGSAGTGKSVLMREIIKQLRIKYRREPDRVAVTASTGLAACNIEGVTLHSFAGIGLGKEAVPELVKKIKRNQKARARWLRTKVLVVDEVSMVDGDLFDKLEEIARRIRNNGRPFGGIQLVVTGDFFQLPPVPEGGREAKFAFSAATWTTSIQHTILLTHVFRQKDPEFADMLNQMRLGKLNAQSIETFKKLARPLNFQDSLEATELFPTRNEVENANGVRMTRLSGDLMTFNAVDSGSIKEVQYRDKLLANCMAPPTIHLKKGAQVMLIKNMEETLVNGSIGRVVAFMDEGTFDHYMKKEEDFAGEGDEDEDMRARKKIKSHANQDAAPGPKWPLVCFIQPDGTERHLLCQPETWKIELPNGEVQAQRQQIPLILAWALSIHKAQGQTLQRVKVDLGRVFEKGQAYVALSRATSQAGLQVTRFDARKVMVHPKVIDFYSKLVSITDVLKTNKSGGQDDGNEFKDELDDEDYLEQMYG